MSSLQSAIVTGAGSGVGRATALALAAAGYNVTLVARRAETLAETARLIAAQQGNAARALPLAADLADPAACGTIVARTLTAFGRLDAIANVAGYAQSCPIEKITPEEWRKTIDTNLSYVMYLTAAAWPTFKEQRRGIIVNVSSMASFDPFPGFAMYAPAKAALNMFTLITAREGGPLGIRAVAVAPGAIETPMLRALFNEKILPMDKTLTPDSVAAVIRDCVTGARAFTPGETIAFPSP